MKWTDLNLSSLKYFIDSIELGSLSLSAKKNHVSRPAISQAIRRIEIAIGYDLIDHQKNKLTITNKGRHFYKQAKKGLDIFVHNLSESQADSIEINLACSASLAKSFIIPALKKMSLVKSSNINIRIGTTAKVRQLVIDNEVRLGLFVDDQKTYDLNLTKVKSGSFNFQSKTGHLVGPLITTESRPEVMHLMNRLKKSKSIIDSHIKVESWSLCQDVFYQMGGACLVPDFVSLKGAKRIRNVDFNYQYNIVMIAKNLNTLSSAEVRLLELLKRHP